MTLGSPHLGVGCAGLALHCHSGRGLGLDPDAGPLQSEVRVALQAGSVGDQLAGRVADLYVLDLQRLWLRMVCVAKVTH